MSRSANERGISAHPVWAGCELAELADGPITGRSGPALEPAPGRSEPALEPTASQSRRALEPTTSQSQPALEPAPGRPGPALEPTTSQSQPALEPAANLSPWRSVPIPAGYTLDQSGVAQGSDRVTADPVWIKAVHIDAYSGAHGLVVEWLDASGGRRDIAVSRGELHAHGSPLAVRLANAGVVVVHGAERALHRYFSEFDIKQLPRWEAVSRVGWIDKDDRSLAYMLPQRVLAHDSHVPIVFQPERESPSSSSVYESGTLKSWNDRVASLCKHNPLLLFPILVGLSGPLLRFAELESGGFHYYGRSSHGKTTAAQAAASVWGNGADPAEAPDRALVQKWNATANAFEALLCAHNDGLLVLDEIHTCDAKDFGAVIYNMASGTGRRAMTRERQLRPTRKWRTMYFSTGEVSVLSKLESDGKIAHAGQLVRLIDIPTEGGIIIDAGSATQAEHAERLKHACSRFFGTAGPALIRGLEGEYENVGQLVGTIKTKVEGHAKTLTPTDAPPEVRRAIKRFALAATAGEMSIRLGVLDCEIRQVDDAVRTALRAWLTDSSRIPDRLRGVIRVAEFIHRHGARFQIARGPIPRDRVGYKSFDPSVGHEVYMFTSEGFREACGGLDPRETAEQLKKLRFLVAKERGRYTEKREVEAERGRYYIVKAALLDFDPSSAPGDEV